MDSVGHTENNQGALARVREERVRGVQLGVGGFLNLTNADTSLANNGANKNVGD
jgi:hypothetical protein